MARDRMDPEMHRIHTSARMKRHDRVMARMKRRKGRRKGRR